MMTAAWGMTGISSTRWRKRDMDLFDNLTEEESLAVENAITLVRFRRGEHIFHAGDRADGIYLVESGTVKLVYENANGDEHILTVFQAGDIFGDLFFGKYRHRIGTARALENTVLGKIGEAELRTLTETCPHIGWNFIRHLADEHRETLARVHALMHVDARYRLLATLLNLSRRHCCVEGDWFALPACLNQDDIANIAGMNRSTASKLINEFRREGLLGGVGRVVTVNHTAVDAILRAAGVEILE